MSLGCPICGKSIEPCCAATVAAHLPQHGLAATAAEPQASRKSAATVDAGKILASKPSTTKNLYTAEFLLFWENYPLKRDKATAARRFAAAVAAGVEPQTMIAGARQYRNDPNRDPAFTKYAEGWITARRWEDELGTVAAPTLSAVKSQEEIQAEWDRQRAEEDARIATIRNEDSG